MITNTFNMNKNALASPDPLLKGPKTNPAGLPSGRLFAVLAYRSVVSGTGTLTTVYSTRDAAAFNEVLAGIKKDMIGKPKMRPHTSGNCREVGVIRIDDHPAAEGLVRIGLMPSIPAPGFRWKSLKEAAAALGLSPHSLRQYFARAKKENGGNSAAVITRGIRISYTDVPAWTNIPADAGRPTTTFAQVSGRRISAAETAEIFKTPGPKANSATHGKDRP